ncbi:hypothetical protein V496_10606 [Pseudogymnoascus sp. VKM F-4515 (FW-2607)]|nr:hypothetical protein V496_10606 [Pseudogymnoascus sp. VKM F-4515 (FW-2607)]
MTSSTGIFLSGLPLAATHNILYLIQRDFLHRYTGYNIILNRMVAYSDAQVAGSPTLALSDRFKGQWFGRQLAETVDEFLQRLPPATTNGSEELQWIWENPPRQPAAMASRDISIARDKAVMDILNLAVQTKVTSGKWMLFPPVHQVNHIWPIIAHAVATGQLGIGAKVSPKRVDPETRSRLICIYTDDFSNKDDVIRVLRKLKELGLVSCGRPIYYKCDAYTHLSLFSGNRWGISETLYNSMEMP